MIRALLRLVAIASLLISALSVGSIAAANADPGQPLFCVHTTPAGAEGCFKANGNVMYAIDTAADGHHVRLDVFDGAGRGIGICENYGGNGSSRSCPLDYGDNKKICLTASVWEGSKVIKSYKIQYYCTTS